MALASRLAWGAAGLPPGRRHGHPFRGNLDDPHRETCDHGKTAGTSRDIPKRQEALWAFVYVEGLEPTNNLAERQIRPGVLWRNGSFGTQSEAGSRFAKRIMTVFVTLKQRDCNMLDYLAAARDAANWGRQAPSLLPGCCDR